MFDEFFQFFLLQVASIPPLNMSWVCNLYYFLACTSERCCAIFFCFGQLQVHHGTWVGFVICTTFYFLACSSEMLCYYCKTASLKGCQIEKFFSPKNLGYYFQQHPERLQTCNQQNNGSWVTSEVILQLWYVLCTCTVFFGPLFMQQLTTNGTQSSCLT
jgi:hypothetical protein